ncbi:unnamed protein product [Calicophoron daubneyi]|uniref:Sulfotransferase domain-containing protein n=1 Tax=Calicophoron daubneyi TaxID=300641 RepID=A0AAV2TVD4_CALDB
MLFGHLLAYFHRSANRLSSSRSIHNLSWSMGKIVSIALILPLSFSVIFASWLRLTNQKRSSNQRTREDPEFSGFKLVMCDPPYLHGDTTGFGRFGSCWLPVEIADAARQARAVLSGHLHPNDVIVASFPKSGTTWLSEIVFLLSTRLDWDKASSFNLEYRVPYLEYIWPGPQSLLNRSVPRVLKTHLPFVHLPEEVQRGRAARVIYIVRDPRDVVVSYYHFARGFVPAGYRNREGIDGFTKRFLSHTLPYCPWPAHVKGYVQSASCQRKETACSGFSPQVLVVRYEELLRNPNHTVRKIEEFLRKTWITSKGCPSPPTIMSDSQISQVVNYCSFKEMSKNPNSNFSWWMEMGLWSGQKDGAKFLRRGEVGNHQVQLSSELAEMITFEAKNEGLGWTLAS